jgi:hypothetical protein
MIVFLESLFMRIRKYFGLWSFWVWGCHCEWKWRGEPGRQTTVHDLQESRTSSDNKLRWIFLKDDYYCVYYSYGAAYSYEPFSKTKSLRNLNDAWSLALDIQLHDVLQSHPNTPCWEYFHEVLLWRNILCSWRCPLCSRRTTSLPIPLSRFNIFDFAFL